MDLALTKGKAIALIISLQLVKENTSAKLKKCKSCERRIQTENGAVY